MTLLVRYIYRWYDHSAQYWVESWLLSWCWLYWNVELWSHTGFVSTFRGPQLVG